MTLSSSRPLGYFRGGNLEKKNIFVQIQEMETQMGQLHSDLGEMKLVIKELLEENNRLMLENERLRKILKEALPVEEGSLLPKPDVLLENDQPSDVVGEGYDNLAGYIMKASIFVTYIMDICVRKAIAFSVYLF